MAVGGYDQALAQNDNIHNLYLKGVSGTVRFKEIAFWS